MYLSTYILILAVVYTPTATAGSGKSGEHEEAGLYAEDSFLWNQRLLQSNVAFPSFSISTSSPSPGPTLTPTGKSNDGKKAKKGRGGKGKGKKNYGKGEGYDDNNDDENNGKGGEFGKGKKNGKKYEKGKGGDDNEESNGGEFGKEGKKYQKGGEDDGFDDDDFGKEYSYSGKGDLKVNKGKKDVTNGSFTTNDKPDDGIDQGINSYYEEMKEDDKKGERKDTPRPTRDSDISNDFPVMYARLNKGEKGGTVYTFGRNEKVHSKSTVEKYQKGDDGKKKSKENSAAEDRFEMDEESI